MSIYNRTSAPTCSRDPYTRSHMCLYDMLLCVVPSCTSFYPPVYFPGTTLYMYTCNAEGDALPSLLLGEPHCRLRAREGQEQESCSFPLILQTLIYLEYLGGEEEGARGLVPVIFTVRKVIYVCRSAPSPHLPPKVAVRFASRFPNVNKYRPSCPHFHHSFNAALHQYRTWGCVIPNFVWM